MAYLGEGRRGPKLFCVAFRPKQKSVGPSARVLSLNASFPQRERPSSVHGRRTSITARSFIDYKTTKRLLKFGIKHRAGAVFREDLVNSQPLLLNIYFCLSEFQSSHLLKRFRYGLNTQLPLRSELFKLNQSMAQDLSDM